VVLHSVKKWLFYTAYGAVACGTLAGLFFGVVLISIVSATAHASQSKTLTLDESYVQGDSRICVYSDAQRVETTQVNKHSKCKSVLTVDVE